MIIELDWLKELVDFKVSTAELARVLTMAGLEVEAIESVDLPDGRKTEVIELNVTPNRGYCLSYFGVAREVAALLGLKCKLPRSREEVETLWGTRPVSERLSVENREPGLCPRYAAMVIENVTPGPSPQWLADRLHACGLRPINNIVDITNFVLLEYGQPLHAFDHQLLAGSRIIVRRAAKGEPFTSLDGTELKLGEDALVIADAENPVALAGIMGGVNSQVTEHTRTVVLESACFDPVTVRQGSRKYGLRTDSSYRFERGVDIEGVIDAQSRAAILIKELAGGEILCGRIDRYPQPREPERITLRISRVTKILGTTLEARDIRGILESLDFKVVDQNGAFQVEVPHFRPTVSREIDLIEEVARVKGYDQIEVSHPVAGVSPVKPSPRQRAVPEIRDLLCHLGYSEAVNYSFIEEPRAREFQTAFEDPQSQPVPLSNPISADISTMRTSLIPGLLKNAARNMSKGQKPVKIFELGHIYFRGADGKEFSEKSVLAALAVGAYENSVWKPAGKSYDFFDLKGLLEAVADHFKVALEFQRTSRNFLQAGRAIDCLAGGRRVGYLGEIASPLTREMDLAQKCYVFEIDLDILLTCLPDRVRFETIPKFPETYRDISILVDKTVRSQTVVDLILEAGSPLIRKLELYDCFEGKKIQEGKKSLTFALTFQSPDRTLTDEEVNPVFEKIVQELSGKLGAALRES